MKKVAILGATSQSTPALFRALRRSSAVAHLRFALTARSSVRLDAIVRAIEIVGEGAFALTRHDFAEASLESAVAEAAAIVIQIRYGGLKGREFDEAFPLQFGVCGDEGLGPGGFSSAWRSWPQVDKLLALIRRISPHAEVVLLTSPCSLLTRLAHLRWPDLRVRALCELPMTTLLASGLPRSQYDYIGINHLGWLYGMSGRNPIALKYWRLHEEAQAVQSEQKLRAETRAAELQRLSDAAINVYATGTRTQIETCLDARPAPWYSHALGPLLESLVTGSSSTHFFLSDANLGRHAQFRHDDVLEIPHHWAHRQLVRKPVCVPVPENLLTILKPFVEYERAAAQIILARTPARVRHALSRHPWVAGGQAQAAGLAGRMLAASIPA